MRHSQKARYIISACMMVVALFSAFILIRSLWPSGGLPYEEVTMEQALSYMEYEGDYMLIDLDEPEEFASSPFVGGENTVNIPYDQLLEDTLVLLQDKASMIYVYSHDDEVSQKAAMKLSSMGFNSVTRITDAEEGAKEDG